MDPTSALWLHLTYRKTLSGLVSLELFQDCHWCLFPPISVALLCPIQSCLLQVSTFVCHDNLLDIKVPSWFTMVFRRWVAVEQNLLTKLCSSRRTEGYCFWSRAVGSRSKPSSCNRPSRLHRSLTMFYSWKYLVFSLVIFPWVVPILKCLRACLELHK